MFSKKFLIIICLLSILAGLALLDGKILAAGDIPFGGRITFVTYCCNGLAVTVGPPRGGNFLFTDGSILHAYYNIYAPGPWVLGLASPGGFCQLPPFCFPMPVDGTIIRVGTSGL